MIAAPYRERYQFSAGVLALLVHGVFFAVMYFGLNWQIKQPQDAMSVELWDALPAPALPPAAPAPTLPPAPDTPPIATPVEKPDIVVPEKPVVVLKPLSVVPPVRTAQKPVESSRKPPQSLLERYGIEGGSAAGSGTGSAAARAGQRAKRAADAEKAAEVQRVLAEYVVKIKAKVKRYVVKPPDVPDDARVEFWVTLLPDGSVLNIRLAKSSGSVGYADAVERAIIKAQPLPLPPSGSELFSQFRELKLVFKPIE